MKRCEELVFRKPVKGLDKPYHLSFGQCRGYMEFKIAGMVTIETVDYVHANIRLGDRWECVECGNWETMGKNQTRIDDWYGPPSLRREVKE